MNRAELKKILGFGYDTERVFGFVRDGFDKTTLNKNLKKLATIGDGYLGNDMRLSEEETRRLIKRLLKSWHDGIPPEEIQLSMIESMSVGFGMEKETTLDFATYLHSTVDNNWAPGTLKGFLISTMMHWYDYAPEVKDANIQFINKHAGDSNEQFVGILPFIASDGPVKLASHLKKQNQTIIWAPPTLMVPSSRINYPYFSATIVSFFQNAKKQDYDELRETLLQHNQTRTDKTLIPILINKASSSDKELLDIAYKRIGDPFDDAKWAPFDGATKSEIKALKQAQRTALSWILQEVIRMFFDVLCRDSERKKFWSRQAHKIKDFTVFGSYFNRQLVLQSIKAPNVIKHYKTVDSSMDNCALAMFFDEYVVVEFTDVGALYAYRLDGENYRQAFKYSYNLSKVDDLKIPTLPMLYDSRTGHSEREGKLYHRGDWQRRMSYWLGRHIIIRDDE